MFSYFTILLQAKLVICVFKQTWKIENSLMLELVFPELGQSLLWELLAF